MTTLYFFDTSKEINIRTRINDIPLISNEEAVIESIKNIVNTKPGERIWSPDFGINYDLYLFQPLAGYYANKIIEDTENAINKFEPRANTVRVEVDIDYDDLLYEVFIFVTVSTSEREVELSFPLDQVR